MSKPAIHFFSEDISYTLKEKTHLRNWITQTVEKESKKLRELNFIFCSDRYLLKINQEYLKHDTFTDIVTFDNSEIADVIVGDIFISIDRVRENASTFRSSERDELHRVMIHGTLHLLGYKDKTKAQKAMMTEKEDHHLQLRNF
jgi:probable rRNA maturation factor